MTAPILLVAGSGVAPRGAHALLAARLVDQARSLGLTVREVRVSRCARSATRHLMIADRQERPWLMRVSGHQRPRQAGHVVPHFDLVSLDGSSGFDLASRYLGQVANGSAEWAEPTRDRHGRRGR